MADFKCEIVEEVGVLVRHGSPKSGYWEIVRKGGANVF